MFCGQGCSLRDSSLPPKLLNRPIISNKYLDVGCKCLACHFDFFTPGFKFYSLCVEHCTNRASYVQHACGLLTAPIRPIGRQSN